MKERPILFSAPMVRAILAGTKTQTRRLVKPQPSEQWSPEVCAYYPTKINRAGEENPGPEVFGATDEYEGRPSPYGKPGDRLWVRETFTLCESIRTDGTRAPLYRATSIVDEYKTVKWKPSIFMPRWASRITLEITGIRVERLQDISEADAIAEGLEAYIPSEPIPWKCWKVAKTSLGHSDPVYCYRMIWESINGPGSWDANPRVWVVEFNRMQKEDA